MRNQWGFVRNYWGSLATNTAPVANAGADQSNIAAGATVTLDFSGSTDGDGTISSYVVTQTAGDTVTLSGTGASRTFTAPTTGSSQTLTFSLVVTDDDGADSTPDTVDIGVLAGVISDTTPPVITLNGTATINLTVGDTYSELGATAIDDTDGSVEVTITGTVNTSIAATYTRFYNAVDAAGNNAVQVTRAVVVSAAANNPPTATITAPTTSTAGATCNVDLRLSDGSGRSWGILQTSGAPVKIQPNGRVKFFKAPVLDSEEELDFAWTVVGRNGESYTGTFTVDVLPRVINPIVDVGGVESVVEGEYARLRGLGYAGTLQDMLAQEEADS